jgi:hypothetical protein
MTEQYCVRTYETNYGGFRDNSCGKHNCEVLNSYLDKVEYIIKREVVVPQL